MKKLRQKRENKKLFKTRKTFKLKLKINLNKLFKNKSLKMLRKLHYKKLKMKNNDWKIS